MVTSIRSRVEEIHLRFVKTVSCLFPLRHGGERACLKKRQQQYLSIALYQQRASLKATTAYLPGAKTPALARTRRLQKNKLSLPPTVFPSATPRSKDRSRSTQTEQTHYLLSLSLSWASQCFGRKSPDDLFLQLVVEKRNAETRRHRSILRLLFFSSYLSSDRPCSLLVLAFGAFDCCFGGRGRPYG